MGFFTRPHKQSEDMFKGWEKDKVWDKAHPIRTFFRETWYEIRYRIPRRIFEDFPREVKRFYQRGRYGIAECDIWGFNYFLSMVAVKGLKYIRKNGQGFPSEFTCDKNGKEIDWRIGSKKWNKVLDKMLYSFQTAEDVMDGKTVHMSYTEWENKRYNRSKSIVRKWKEEHEDDMPKKVMTKKQAKAYEEGFELFGRYFLSLWD